VWYSYAVIRVVPRVERGESINAGVVLFARTTGYLRACVELDTARLLALAPEADIQTIERHLRQFCSIAEGNADGGPMAELPPSERFHWLTAPRSTVIQTSPVHMGTTDDLDAALDDLLNDFVRPPTTDDG
jgi:hypothetical protein